MLWHFRFFTLAGLLLVLISGSALLAARMRYFEPAGVDPAPEPGMRIPTEMAQIVSMGMEAALVDFLWIRILQDPAIQPVESGKRASIFPDMDLLTDLDPAHSSVYFYICPFLSVVRRDGEGAKSILLKGEEFRTQELQKYPLYAREKYWASEWYLPFTLAFTFFHVLKDIPSASRYFRLAGALPGAPLHIQNIAKRVETEAGQLEFIRRYLEFLVRQARDSVILSGYEKELQAVETRIEHLRATEKLIAMAKSRGIKATDPRMKSFLSNLISNKLFPPYDSQGGRYLWDLSKLKVTTDQVQGGVYGFD